jgi:DNA-binding MarR family transcriptional regulator
VTDAAGMAQFEEELASRLGSYIKRAEQALMAEKARVLREHGLTVAQYSALMLLRYVPEASAAQLSRACLVTPQTMATILRNLEQKGLVTRDPSPLHLRVLSTRLTATGTFVVGDADHVAKGVERDLSAHFAADERDQLKQLLDRAITTLQDRTNSHRATSRAVPDPGSAPRRHSSRHPPSPTD